MTEVTVIHATGKKNLLGVMALGLLVREPDQAIGTIGFDIVADQVAQEMGIPDRRIGRIFATLPHWESTGVGWITRSAFVAFEIDGDETYAYNADIITAQGEVKEIAREYWNSRRRIADMISIPAPGEYIWEILVNKPIPPWKVRVYRSFGIFWKSEGEGLRAKGYLPPDPEWLGRAPAW